MATITTSRERYEALRVAAENGDQAEITRICKLIDAENGIELYILWVRWQDVGGVAPVQIASVPYPPLTSTRIRQTRAISRQDVLDAVTAAGAANPADIHVTPDRHGEIGWTELDVYFP